MVIKKNNFGDKPNSFVTCPGDRIKQLYIGEVQKDGQIKLVPSGKKDVYAEIQSYAEMVDINNIVERYQNGEIDILNQIQGTYSDISNMTTDPAEALRLVRDAEREFYNLPVDLRSKFGNDVNQFIASAGSEEWFEKVLPKKEEVKVEEEVKE